MPNYFLSKSHRFLAQDGPATNADRQRFSFIKCPANLPPQNGPGNRTAASSLQTGSLCPFWCVLFSSLEAFLKLYYRESCLSSIGATSSPAAPWRKCRPSKGPFFSVPWYIAAFVMLRLLPIVRIIYLNYSLVKIKTPLSTHHPRLIQAASSVEH